MDIRKLASQTLSQLGVITSSAPSTKGHASTDFTDFIAGVLTPDSAHKANEEDLFSAIVQERVKNAKGDGTLKKFQETLSQTKDAMKRPDGSVPVEDATKAALRKAREAGLITKEEADTIYSEAFAAAQLDDNKEVLYDGRGGEGDPTIAVAAMEQALLLSGGMVEKFNNGSLKATIRSVEEAMDQKIGTIPGQHSESGESGGFLYKPVSDNTGKLVVLMPSKLAGMISGVKIYDPAGNLLESGRHTGNGNGGRDHYRFKKTGAAYPDGLVVEATLTTGDTVRYRIGETSRRTENINPTNDNRSSSEYDPSESDAGRRTTGGDSTSADNWADAL
ncbi:MAG: hypothetical protein RIS36_933 [Pseudomonadota bacterium]|jgi:hypothetical protein